jgi:protein-S-isoprenylcysteine O-methyltransferase Ste14
MNPFGWKDWIELPYRGDGEPTTSKRKKRFANLRKERRETIKIIIGAIVLFAVIFGCILSDPTTPYDNSIKIVSIVIGLILVLVFVMGILSLTKFRKGFDVDISDEKEKDNRDKE